MKQWAKYTLTVFFILAILFTYCLPLFALTPSVGLSSSYMSGPYYKNLMAVNLTGDMRRDIVSVAQSQVGYHESSSKSDLTGLGSGSGNCTEYNYFMTNRTDYSFYGGGWCGMFVSWCAAIAGVPESVLSPSAMAQPSGSGSFRFFGTNALNGASYMGFTELAVKGGIYTPLPGDIIFYSSSAYTGNPTGVSYKHVGIVESCTYTYNADGSIASLVLTTLEGNTSDKVSNKKWTVKPDGSGYVYSGCYIAGFGIPAYTTSVLPDSSFYDIGAYDGSLLRKGSTGITVFRLQLALSLLSEKYPTIYSPEINGIFDEKTEIAVKQYQSALSLDTDGLVGPDTWGSLRFQLNAFTGASKSDFIVRDGKLCLYKGNNPTVRLPDEVTSVGAGAFMDCGPLLSLRFPVGFKTIEANAFVNCASLEKVIYMCSEQNFSSLSIDYMGNQALKNAAVEYGTCTITFVDGMGERTEIECKAGDLPTAPELPEIFEDDEFIYYLIGWDEKIVPAVDDHTYTALYILVPSAPVSLSLGEKLSCGGKSVFLPLQFSGNNFGISEAVFSIDYRKDVSRLIYTDFSDGLPGVSVKEAEPGLLEIKLKDIFMESGNALTLHFEVPEGALPGEILLDFLADPKNSVFCSDDGVNMYALNCTFTSGKITIDESSFYDMDDDGILSIVDATLMLNHLAHNEQTHDPGPRGPMIEYSIAHVTELLNILSAIENDR